MIELIHKKLRNEAFSADEERNFSIWVSSEKNRKIFEEYKRTWVLSGQLLNILEPNVDLQWEKFKNNQQKVSPKVKVLTFKRVVSAIAAIFILAFALGVLLKTYSNTHTTYYTDNITKEIVLPDNSLVALNVNSKLEVSKKFNKENRCVKLQGEAMFEVMPNEKSPFVVELSDGLEVRVLGTKFNVRSYLTTEKVELKVVEGKVSFGNGNDEVVIKKGEEVDFNKNSHSFSSINHINKNLLAWRTQKFEFDNTPIVEVVGALERYLNKQIKLPENSDTIRYTGAFENPTDTQIAEVLSLALGWEYKLVKSGIVFSQKKVK